MTANPERTFPSDHGIQSKMSCSFNTAYQSYVKALCGRYPSLTNLDNFLSNPRGRRDGCKVTALDFRVGNHRPTVRKDLPVVGLAFELPGSTCWENGCSKDAQLQGRILIIQDLTQAVVETLGSRLDIDPLFFALHLHTSGRSGMSRQTPEDATLPSRRLSQGYINMSYHRAITADPPKIARKLLRDTAIDRKLVFLPSTNIGLVQHYASVIAIKSENDFWIGKLVYQSSLFSLRLKGSSFGPCRPPGR